ncbi:MAG: hypothetical protein N2645_11190 [Clostridia bacterium]|nr:hypothetical protein [Clostridia bacterium]
MSINNSINCPDEGVLESYFLGKLEDEINRQFEEHFYSCDRCIAAVRRISHDVLKISTIMADPYQGYLIEQFYDTTEEFKCAGDDEVKELKTKNKRYRLLLRPFDEPGEFALLEIQVLDPSVSGSLTVYINGKVEKRKIDKNRLVYLIVKSDIDLKNIIIRH